MIRSFLPLDLYRTIFSPFRIGKYVIYIFTRPTTTEMLKMQHIWVVIIPCIFSFVICEGSGSQSFSIFMNICMEDRQMITENEVRVCQSNYTVMAQTVQNESLMLTMCIGSEDPDIATAHLLHSETFNLQTEQAAQFDMSVKGWFVGRAYIDLVFVFSLNKSQDLCESVSPSGMGESAIFISQGNKINLTHAYPPDVHSPVVFMKRHEVVVIREERAIDTAFNIVVILLVCIVNLGLGCKTELTVVKDTLRRPIAPITGFCSQFIIMPLISFGAVKVFNFEPALALGFFALGCSPGGSASNAYTLLLEGDVSLSITMTLISTLGALGMIPLWLFTLGQLLYSHSQIKIPYQNIIYSLLGLVIPVGIGFLIKQKRPNWAKVLVKVSKGLMVVFLIFVLTVGIYANLYIFRLMTLQVLLTAALLPYLGFILGGVVAFIMRMPRHHVLTVAIETGIQNTGIAIVLLLLSLDHPESDISIVAPIASAIFTPIPLWVAIAILHIRRRFCQKHTSVPLDDHAHSPDHHDMDDILPSNEENGIEARKIKNNK